MLGVLGKIVDYDLASVLMLDDRTTYLTVARETSHAQYGEFFAGVADTASQVTGQVIGVHDLQVAGRRRRTSTSGPRTRAGWRPSCRCRCVLAAAWSACSGCRARSRTPSARPRSNTLRLVEAPAAVVIDNARLSGYQPA